MEAVILAGGFGTRLKQVVSDVPKPMADINGRPFLAYILDWLSNYKCTHAVLAVGYKKDVIMNYFGSKYKDIFIEYSIEDTPLFTGGAVKKALKKCREENIFVINGDTYFNVDIDKMLAQHIDTKADFTVAIKDMVDFDRYGTVQIKKNRIVGFTEKKYYTKGFINGGIYCIKKDLLKDESKEAFSLERDFMEVQCNSINMYAFESDEYFIDIGIPKDYFRAQIDLK